MNDLDVTITAVRRPSIFRLTAESFRKNLFAGNFRTRAILNIDPLGGGEADADAVERIARANFDEVLVRRTEQGSFGEAVRWAWSNARTPWVLHLEDDWLLVRKVDVDVLQREMQEPGVVGVRFYLKRNRKAVYRSGISLNPSFFKLELLQRLLPGFNPAANPEKQLPELPAGESIRVHGPARAPQMVLDIGRNWRAAAGMQKGSGASPMSAAQDQGMLKQAYFNMKHACYMQGYRVLKAISGLRRKI